MTTQYTYAAMSFNTAAQALEAALMDYVSACGNNPAHVAKDELADTDMTRFSDEWPQSFEYDAEDFATAKMAVSAALDN